jgi:hypothetical protein
VFECLLRHYLGVQIRIDYDGRLHSARFLVSLTSLNLFVFLSLFSKHILQSTEMFFVDYGAHISFSAVRYHDIFVMFEPFN